MTAISRVLFSPAKATSVSAVWFASADGRPRVSGAGHAPSCGVLEPPQRRPHPRDVLGQHHLLVVGQGTSAQAGNHPVRGGHEGVAGPDQVEELGRPLEVPDDRGEFAGPLELLTA